MHVYYFMMHGLWNLSTTYVHAKIYRNNAGAHSFKINEGINRGGSREGANHNSGSLKHGVWGCSPQKLKDTCFVFKVQKCHLIQDLEYLIQISKCCEKELTKVVQKVGWVQPFGRFRLYCIEMY